mmetsp:Transcript_12846/g.42558  ORF Transcript_12846/g.42558 Transcript_12846/m.42558 type:complete len:264 (-) Transcript_12846:1283-2074(-)
MACAARACPRNAARHRRGTRRSRERRSGWRSDFLLYSGVTLSIRITTRKSTPTCFVHKTPTPRYPGNPVLVFGLGDAPRVRFAAASFLSSVIISAYSSTSFSIPSSFVWYCCLTLCVSAFCSSNATLSAPTSAVPPVPVSLPVAPPNRSARPTASAYFPRSSRTCVRSCSTVFSANTSFDFISCNTPSNLSECAMRFAMSLPTSSRSSFGTRSPIAAAAIAAGANCDPNSDSASYPPSRSARSRACSRDAFRARIWRISLSVF